MSTLPLFTALLMMAATSAWADTNYGIGDRILGMSNVVANDYVVIEAISSTNNRGYYITETDYTESDGKYTWKKGFEQASVWKLVPYSGNAYYLQNAETSHYMGGTRDNPTTVSSLNDAVPISVYDSTSLHWSWTTYNDGSSGWDKNSFVLRVNNDLCLGNDVANKDNGSFNNGGALHNIQWNMYKAVDLSAIKYKIGKRVTQLSDLYDGELVYIQSSDLARYYCYFINEKTDGTFVWNGGYSDNYGVWKLIKTGANQYYLQNQKTGNYMMSYQSSSTDPQVGYTTSDIDSAGKVTIYTLTNGGLGRHSYDAASLTRGWDDSSFNLHSDDWFHNAEACLSSGKIFTRSGEHNSQFNIYTAEIDDGTGETFEPGKVISSVSDIKTNRAYTLITQGRGLIETNPDHTKAISTGDNDQFSKTNGSTEVGFNQWVLRPNPNGDGTYYLYNVAADKYLTADESTGNTLTDDAEDAMTINTTSTSNYFTFTVSSKNNRRIRLISGNAYFDTKSDSDGPLFQIIETAVVSPDEIFESSTVSSLVLKDKVDYTLPTYSFTASTATYTRENLTSNWGTIMLPYDVDANDDVAFYSIDSESGGVLTVTKANKLTAGTPALFKTNGATSVTFSASPATVKPTTQTATGDGLTLVGTYTKDTIDVDNTYYIKDDKFYSKGDGINFIVNPFRAYMKSDGSTNSNAFSIVVDDDPTGITRAATSADASDEIEGVYSVNGVKLSDLQKGINIIRYRSGKTQKVILK